MNGWQAAWVSERREAASAAGGPPARKRLGRPGWSRREALGQDADLQECALAGCCSYETKWVCSSSRKRDDRRDGEVGWGTFGEWECLK